MWFGKDDKEHWERYDAMLVRTRAEMEEKLDGLRKELAEFLADREKAEPKDVAARLADLEIKMAKLWALLLETSPVSGKEKLTKFGRMFGGKAKDLGR